MRGGRCQRSGLRRSTGGKSKRRDTGVAPRADHPYRPVSAAIESIGAVFVSRLRPVETGKFKGYRTAYPPDFDPGAVVLVPAFRSDAKKPSPGGGDLHGLEVFRRRKAFFVGTLPGILGSLCLRSWSCALA